MSLNSEFRPWEKDYLRSFFYYCIALCAGWSVMLAGHPYWAVACLVIPGIRAMRWFNRGYRRERGIEVEREAIGQATAWLGRLRGCGIEANRAIPFNGNIDLIVRLPDSKVAFVVEIKSYEGIVQRPYGITKLGKFFSLFRELKQVKGQSKHMGSEWYFPVIWCPLSMCNNVFEYRQVLIVNGNVQLLDYALERHKLMVRVPITVSFPSPPPLCYRTFLKVRGFQFRDSKVWEGRASQVDAQRIREFVAEAGGRLY